MFGIIFDPVLAMNQKSANMKNLIFIAILICLFNAGNAQTKLQGIMIEKAGGFHLGDTVTILGYKASTGQADAQFLIKKGLDYKPINFSKIKLLSENIDFWDNIWFNNRSSEIITGGWDTKIRADLRNDATEFISNLSKNNLIFKDELMEDYLYQLVHKIAPRKLNKETECNYTVIIMKANEVNIFSFDNGTIILTTGLLCDLHSEQELSSRIAGEIAKLVLDYNVLNVKQQILKQHATDFWVGFSEVASSALMSYSNVKYHTNYTGDDALIMTAASAIISGFVIESIGAKNTQEQLQKSNDIINTYMNSIYDKWNHKSNQEFIGIAANVISFMAWQQFYSSNYKYCIELINRLESAGIPSEENYLLKSKIYRLIYNTDEANYEALECIKRAKSLGLNKLIDLEKEEGLLYLRIGNKEKAKQSFHQYKTGLEEMQAKGENNTDELHWVTSTIYNNGLL